MAICSVCGEVDESLIHTCNHCGRKNCAEHQLPENHLCIPPKSGISDDADGRDRNWSSEKHKRKNVMADARRSETSYDPRFEHSETKRPLEEDEIDADSESSPTEWVEDVKRNREALNERLAERHREWESKNSSDENAGSSPDSDAADGAGRLLFVTLGLLALLLGAAVLLGWLY